MKARTRSQSELRSAPVQIPEFFEPMRCQEKDTVPLGENWEYELKFDGWRAVAAKRGKTVHLYSRRGTVFDQEFPEVVAALKKVPVQSFIIDGEIVAVADDGRHSFSLLENRKRTRQSKADIRYYIFDVLGTGNSDFTNLPLWKRRKILHETFRELPDQLRLSPVLTADPAIILNKVRELKLEGIVAKKKDSQYIQGGRPGTWVKIKTQQTDDFVIGGYIPGPNGVQDLLVGATEAGDFRYVASVHGGFTPRTRREVFRVLHALEMEHCPFENLPEKKGQSRMDAEKMKEARWIKPVVLCEIGFTEKTAANHLRHAKFLRLRQDQ